MKIGDFFGVMFIGTMFGCGLGALGLELCDTIKEKAEKAEIKRVNDQNKIDFDQQEIDAYAYAHLNKMVENNPIIIKKVVVEATADGKVSREEYRKIDDFRRDFELLEKRTKLFKQAEQWRNEFPLIP